MFYLIKKEEDVVSSLSPTKVRKGALGTRGKALYEEI